MKCQTASRKAHLSFEPFQSESLYPFRLHPNWRSQ
jgi:hypothetical protein